jgi:hypothetical protein
MCATDRRVVKSVVWQTTIDTIRSTKAPCGVLLDELPQFDQTNLPSKRNQRDGALNDPQNRRAMGKEKCQASVVVVVQF